jgi:hypothetical protein
MWNKIYLSVLFVALGLMGFLTFYAHSWLGSIGDPKTTKEFYEFYFSLSWTILWISSLTLLILGHVLLWKTRKSWALWTTLAFFSGFTLALFFWLELSFSAFKKSKGLSPAEFPLSPILGVFFIIIAAVIFFGGYFLNLRLYERFYPPKESEAELQTTEKA